MAPGSSSPASPQPFKLILGSSSVARKHILEEMGLDFQVMTADIDEKSIRRENPDELVMVLAEAKADAIMARLNIADYQKEGNKPTLLITSDIHTTGPSATKRRRVASTKRVKDSTASTAETTKKKQPAAKRFKPPMAGNKQMPPVVTSTVVVGSSPTATGSPVVTSSVVVRRSPEVRSTPVVTVPPTMRLAISPVVLQSPAHIPHNSSASPSFREERLLSSTTSPATQYPGSMSTQNKPRKLKSDIWNDMDPIYGDDGKLINARCKHCNEVVVHKGIIREKPTTKEEARQFLKGYSGGHVTTVGSVVVTNLTTGKRLGSLDKAEVYFHDIPDEVIENLIDEGVVFRVAGGLLLEHPLTLPFVEAVVGSSDSVMGLSKEIANKLIHDALSE